MPSELSPENSGRLVTDDGVYFSASAIAEMNISGLPGSRAGVYKRAMRDGWPVIHQKGRGARDGVQYFKVPEHFMADSSSGKPDRTYQTEPIKPLASGSGEQPRLVSNDHPRDDSYVYIDKYVNVRGAAGPGELVGDEAIVQVRVPTQLLRERVGNNFSHIKVAGVSGDSMEPTLSHGDQVLVDTSCTRFVDDAIYAIQQDGYLRFKRIQLKLDGSIIVKSDNPVNGPETYTAEQAQYFKVIGVVIPFKFGRFKL